MTTIPGYRHGDPTLPASPVRPDDLDRMKKTCLFGEADAAALREAQEKLAPHVEAILDVWYGFVASQPHLVAAFAEPGGPPSAEYLGAVRRRFGQWILDTTSADYSPAWLDYQLEIGRRHHRIGKNRADGVEAADHIRFLDLIPLVYPIFATIRPFLEQGGTPAARVDAMQHAWLKSLLMQITLWSHPYVREGDF